MTYMAAFIVFLTLLRLFERAMENRSRPSILWTGSPTIVATWTALAI